MSGTTNQYFSPFCLQSQLKKKKVSYFTSKNEFIWEQQRVANQDTQTITKAIEASPTNEGKEPYFMEKKE